MATLLIKVSLASAALGLVCWSAQRWLFLDWAQMAFAGRLGGLLLTIGVGILAYMGCGVALRIEELRELMSALRRRARHV